MDSDPLTVLVLEHLSNDGVVEYFAGFYECIVQHLLSAVIQTQVPKRHYPIAIVDVNIVKSLILYTLDRKDEALNALEEALTLAEISGYLRIFLDEGQPMRELLQLALAAGIRQAYTRKLLLGFGDTTTKPTAITPPKPGLLIDPLSERELQVLRLLKTSLSVPEIAEEIHLSPTTVRTHVQHIYQKLGVHGRIEALQKAEELGIL